MSTARLRPLNTTTNTTARNPKATHYSKPPTPTMEATFTLKVNSATQRGGTQKKKTSTGGGGGNSIGSSEASDPLESIYSGEEAEEEEEDDDEDEEEGEDAETDEDDNVAATTAAAAAAQVSRSEQKNTTRASTLTENDSDKENAAGGNSSSSDDDDDDESEVANKAKQTIQKRTTETTTTLKKSNAMDTAKGARTYNFDDFQLIKTVGTGTFGRVCLCRDRLTEKYCAMKILAMTDVIRLKQVDHVKNEKNILCEIKHPFVISLEWSTKDDCCLYMIFEYISGGELFTYLRNAGRFNCQTANFFAAETVSALEYLHSLQIVYRDLKPENLLINRDGHLKITDFGFAKKLRDRTWTLCGTPEYLAPEIIQLKGHNKAVDWWALGILIYEMIVGYPPFYDENPIVIYEKILSGKIEWPRQMDPIARNLIKKLLTNDRTKRLGNMKNGADDVKRHRWFKHLNWNDVYSKKLK